MTVSTLEIWQNEESQRPLFSRDLWSKDALATYTRLRWPTNTAKQAAREWDLSLDEAKGLIASRTSQTTIDKIFKHRNGGWRVAIPLLGAVIGRDLDGFLAEEQARLLEEQRRYEAQERHLAEMAGKVRTLFAVWRSDVPQPDPGPSELLGQPSSDLGGGQAGDAVGQPNTGGRRP